MFFMTEGQNIWFGIISKSGARPIEESFLPTGAIFGFHYPKKFSEREAWSKEDATSASAYFYENNIAATCSNEERQVPWLVAYNQIACSLYGRREVPLPVRIEQALPTEAEFKALIQAWVDLLNEIPFVKAVAGEEIDFPIFVNIPVSPEDILHITKSKSLGKSECTLSLDYRASWEVKNHHDAENDTLAQYLNEYESWQAFYESLVEYINALLKLISIPEPIAHPLDVASALTSDMFELAISKRNENLNKWVNMFNAIPCVKASIYDGDSPNYKIEVDVKNSSRFLDAPTEGCGISTFYLASDHTWKQGDFESGDMDQIFGNWRLDEGTSWEYFLNKVIELNQLYLNSVPAVPELA